MNTPAHAVVNLVLLGRRGRPRTVLPILLGAILPDLPVPIFYAMMKLHGMPERLIWSRAYFENAPLQLCLDVLHSLPLSLLGLGIAWTVVAARPVLVPFFASLALHSLFDLPLHNEDAHRHFLPLSGWRFHSPISYWDPRHHGQLGAAIEAVAVVAGCAILVRRYRSTPLRLASLGLAAIYVVYLGYAFVAWERGVRMLPQ